MVETEQRRQNNLIRRLRAKLMLGVYFKFRGPQKVISSNGAVSIIHLKITIWHLSRYRRNGIATILLETFIDHLQSSEQNSKIKAIYLHVLTSNQPAILFYERYKWVVNLAQIRIPPSVRSWTTRQPSHSNFLFNNLFFL